MFNPYEVLGVPDFSDLSAIKKAYRAIARVHHPDVTGGDVNSTAIYIEAQRAYNELTNDSSRAEIDMELRKKRKGGGDEGGSGEKRTATDTGKKSAGKERNFGGFSAADRTNFQTEKIAPGKDFEGKVIAADLEFFYWPEGIGRLVYGFSDVSLGSDDPLSKRSWISQIFGTKKRVSTNYLLAVNGFSHAEKTEKAGLVTVEGKTVRFDEVHSIFIKKVEHKVSYQYHGTEFLFHVYGKQGKGEDFKLVPLWDRYYRYDKDIGGDVFALIENICKRIDDFWLQYQLDVMELELIRTGYLSFIEFDEELDVIRESVRLSEGVIDFVGRKRFVLSEIGRVYTKGSHLWIEGKDFRRGWFGHEGSRAGLNLSNLCNRRYFEVALELLTGYSL